MGGMGMWYVISGKELEWYLDQGVEMCLVDLRMREDYTKLHIKGAINIPMEEFWQRIGELPKDRIIILYCYHGPNSMRTARKLSREGYQVADVYGGLQAYRGKYMVYSR